MKAGIEKCTSAIPKMHLISNIPGAVQGKGRGRGGKGKARMGGVISRGQGHAKAKHDTVTHYNAITQALIRR